MSVPSHPVTTRPPPVPRQWNWGTGCRALLCWIVHASTVQRAYITYCPVLHCTALHGKSVLQLPGTSGGSPKTASSTAHSDMGPWVQTARDSHRIISHTKIVSLCPPLPSPLLRNPRRRLRLHPQNTLDLNLNLCVKAPRLAAAYSTRTLSRFLTGIHHLIAPCPILLHRILQSWPRPSLPFPDWSSPSSSPSRCKSVTMTHAMPMPPKKPTLCPRQCHVPSINSFALTPTESAASSPPLCSPHGLPPTSSRRVTPRPP